MKGVIVQIGEPKSIVLYNSGKIGAIPTPSNCHVGMVVNVQYNEKLKILLIALISVLLVSAGIIIGLHLSSGGSFPAPGGTGIFPPPTGTSGGGWTKDSGTVPPSARAGSGDRRRGPNVSVNEAKKLPDDSSVVLTGNIVESLGKEKYLFRDSSGDITVDIERKLWRDFSADENDTLEITGEVDIEKERVEIEVKSIWRLAE